MNSSPLPPLAALLLALSPDGPAGAASFVRGDADGSGSISITDSIRVLQFLFLGNPAALECQDAGDADDSGALDLTDAIAPLRFLFEMGAPPPAPFPDCGDDPTEDALGCEAAEGCGSAIGFYEKDFIADGIFFVVDTSGSMQDSGELMKVQRELILALDNLDPEDQFGVIFFSAGVMKFPASGQPAGATDAMKASATSFIESIRGSSGSCPQPGLREAVRYAHSSTARRAAIVYVGDGGGTCAGQAESSYLSQTLAAITAENAGRARIHTIGVLTFPRLNETFMRDLAAQNGGTYTRAPR